MLNRQSNGVVDNIINANNDRKGRAKLNKMQHVRKDFTRTAFVAGVRGSHLSEVGHGLCGCPTILRLSS